MYSYFLENDLHAYIRGRWRKASMYVSGGLTECWEIIVKFCLSMRKPEMLSNNF